MRPHAVLASALRLGLIMAAALQPGPLPAQAPAKAKAIGPKPDDPKAKDPKAIGPKPDDPRGKEAKPVAKPAPAKR
jgi:hypothetical protein